jgi:hypothetical protein
LAENYTSTHPHAHGQASLYDNGIDIGFFGISSTESLAMRYNMPDNEYHQLMKSLNRQQTEVLYDTIHKLKTADTQLFRFISGGAGTGKRYLLRHCREMSWTT